MRSCPSWNKTLPGAWQVEAVREGQGQTLYGTAQAQQKIWDWQNPYDCSDKKFLVHKSQLSGIGSMLHQVGS